MRVISHLAVLIDYFLFFKPHKNITGLTPELDDSNDWNNLRKIQLQPVRNYGRNRVDQPFKERSCLINLTPLQQKMNVTRRIQNE